jgi:hypothetical protein
MKALLVILSVCVITITASAQYNKKSKGRTPSQNSAAGLPLSERLYFGGGGGFSAGTDTYGNKYTYISISPLVGYRLTLPWSAGVQVMYSTYRYPQLGYNLNQYGISPFTQYRFGKLFAQVEYQAISAPSLNSDMRQVYSRLPMGLGFTQPIGPRAAINAVAMYDVLYNKRTSVFPSPFIVRVYITAGGISF